MNQDSENPVNQNEPRWTQLTKMNQTEPNEPRQLEPS